MALLTTLNDGPKYLKAGFLGFNGSGKTMTGILLAVGIRKYFGLQGPIAMFDTEQGSAYINAYVKRETGQDLMGHRSRAFDDLLGMGQECQAAGISVLFAESMTHVWRELCEAYLAQVNARVREQNERFGKHRPFKKNLEFQDWNPLKNIWAHWTDFYLNSPMHIIIAGRAGYEYDMSENEEGKKELTKVGIKMKTEGEFGFEPSLLVEMEREQVPDREAPGGFQMCRRATVIKDRFAVIDGATTLNPTFDFFLPHVQLLKGGSHVPVDTSVHTDAGVDAEGDDGYAQERKRRAIACEEIQGELVNAYPGQTAPEKKAKTDILFATFKTRSWTAVEGMDADRLREGLSEIRKILSAMKPSDGRLFPPTEEEKSMVAAQEVVHGHIDRLGWDDERLAKDCRSRKVGDPKKMDVEATRALGMYLGTLQPE